MKTPPHPEDVAEDLRDRIKKGDLTLGISEAMRIIVMLERLSQRCGEAYQVARSLAGFSGMMDDPAVQKALDLFSFPLRPGAILPFITQLERELAPDKRRVKAKRSGNKARKKPTR